MKLCNSWLREYVAHGLDPEALSHRLTMLGLEVDALEMEGAPLERVVVGRVLARRPHPNADRLSLCRVDVGATEPLDIVCGAPNVREGGLYPTALEGARLPGGLTIKATRLRGEPSAGMLCSATELGLDIEAEGLLELDADAIPGTDVGALLELGDAVLDLNITPNRADCFSILGVAREVAAAGQLAPSEPAPAGVAATIPDTLDVLLPAPAACPRFAGRIIRGLREDARTPLWMRERLRRCGVRPISPVVDVTNYVMLELGQPMHAYDLASLEGPLAARLAHAGEGLELLDGRQVQLQEDVLVIADAAGPVGLAGIMGGSRTAVAAASRDIFLEAAFFAPAALAGRARRFGLHTDASLRFERGVDPTLAPQAIERATRLIMDIAGGQAGPLVDRLEAQGMPARPPVRLRRARMQRVLGIEVADDEVADILRRLHMQVVPTPDGWELTPPGARFDINCEEDLIEEVARLHGYERIPVLPGTVTVTPARAGETVDPAGELGGALVTRGYQEAITYSFIEAGLARRFGADAGQELMLSNPISAELAVMRQSLWPGLALAAGENLRRQQPRVRLFELGSHYLAGDARDRAAERHLAGIAVGSRWPEQWGEPSRRVDFFDVKADVEMLLATAGQLAASRFVAERHPALHPGRSARIVVAERPLGWLGEMHPALAAELDLQGAILFELAIDSLQRSRPAHGRLSVFPAVRRDVAMLVARDVPADQLLAVARAAAPQGILRDSFIFDLYMGPQVGDTQKSVAIGLILQDSSRTLTDEDVHGVLQDVRAALSREFQARIRE